MNVKEALGAFLLVNNPIVLSEEETKDVQKAIKQLQKENKQLEERINKALNKIDNMFDRSDTSTIIDDLLELDKILKGSDSNGQ